MSDCFYKTSVSLTIENYPGFCQEKKQKIHAKNVTIFTMLRNVKM